MTDEDYFNITKSLSESNLVNKDNDNFANNKMQVNKLQSVLITQNIYYYKINCFFFIL